LNQVRYSLVTNEQGGILDDVLVGYYHNAHGQPYYVVVVNASNREKIVRWIDRHLTKEQANVPGSEVLWNDVTRLWAMFAIQGPKSVELLQPLVDADLASMRYYNGEQVRILHPSARRQGGILSRTGYTGEDGFELSVGAEIAAGVWETLIELGRPLGLIPSGLGARDTLRLEAGMPLYGHELSERIHPFEAGLGYACYLSGYDFPGRDALLALKDAPRERVRVGVVLEGRRPARQGCPLFTSDDDQPIGHVTSGSFSPTLQKPIAMAMVPPAFAEAGTPLAIDIRGRRHPAHVVPLPFYQRTKKKKTR
jgi:aminomethyltransferase